MRLSLLAVWCLACAPAARFESAELGRVTFDVADPRCVPTKTFYTPTLTVAPDAGADGGFLAWDQVEVRVDGLPPCRLLDIVFGQAQGGQAYAVFQADYDGVVSTRAHAPLRGSWSGVDIDGPISTSAGARFVQNVTVLADWGLGPYLEGSWPRRESSVGIDVLPVRGARGVYGDLYLPSTQSPWPGIIVIGGREGGQRLTVEVARTFVEQGYLVFGLSYFGAEPLPSRPERIPLEYFLQAIEVLSEYPGANVDKLAVIGVSQGADAALLVGAASPKVKAVVSVMGTGVSWPAFEAWTEPAWTFQDAGVPFIPWASVPPAQRALDDGGVELTFVESFRESLRLASADARDAGTIAVERIGGPVLLMAADDDRFWASCERSTEVLSRLTASGHSTRHPLDDLECFAGAGHGANPGFVGLPHADTVGFERPDGGVVDALGGTPQGNGRASRAMWERASAFLRSAFR